MKNKGAIIIILVVAAALIVSAGIAIASGASSSGGAGNCAVNETAEGVKAANQFRLENQGEDADICNRECTETRNGDCEGDCDCDRDRDRLQDGSCDGEQNQNSFGSRPAVEEAAAIEASGEAWNGNCAGDCDRLQDGSCDGDCDVEQNQNCRRTGAE